ncbi:2-isopropylmalate synthase [Anaeropeptidivorans aminofermentans]|uniref:2-isopropylmalate synthase n=1 Tax=Anaeropeptidivorans aminofermentans TaxID=2934315 RepID=UPI0020253544|nr:2-isopropylmalate synthase [Anaeropeptidivorans aminofermentans]MBE6011814.1 2-isopropylmalate synthase [Lachnospiraceae bacterium]
MNYRKYKAFKPVNLVERKWPNKIIEKAPIWCSVDLRDGNQALETPMNLEQKVNFFKFLVKMGFKEIEIGFPAASETEFAFARKLIEDHIIPDDVTVQVLTQAREHIIRKTFEALEGVNKAVVHLYNSTSTLQRKVVFGKSKEEIKALAVEGAKLVKNCAEEYGSHRFIFEYSPESFTGTELDYAVDVCNAVIDAFKPTKDHKVIINLPSTVEMSTPNVYADQIEYMCTHINQRENVIISLHTHNDRGTGVAASELGLLAGADRIEGTLFGNGERTGNADILNLALNMYSQGIDPGLDFSDIERIVEVYERSTMLNVHPRHPYAGKLVYTAFSGSHQDAIKKGFSALKNKAEEWEVPYLPIDPKDLGRDYEAIIRINSQSGKGGVSYILEENFGLKIPKNMQQSFGNIVTDISDKEEKELLPSDIFKLFEDEYINVSSPVDLISYSEKTNGESIVKAVIAINKDIKEIDGKGNGLIDGFCKAVMEEIGIAFEISHYSQHAMEEGSKSRAITYVGIKNAEGKEYFGAGTSESISRSSIKAVVSAVNNMHIKQ